MPTLTLLNLKDQIRRLGNYENSAVVTPTLLTEWINRALEDYHQIVVDAYEGHYDKIDESLVTVAGTQTVNLPSDFLRLRLLERKIGTDEYVELRRINLTESRRYQGRATPIGYSLFGGAIPGTLRMWPVPDGVYTIRATYIPKASQLAADGDSFVFLPGGDTFVIYQALGRLDERDQRPSTADRYAMAVQAEAKLRSEVPKRDSAEPEYLIPRLGGWSEED